MRAIKFITICMSVFLSIGAIAQRNVRVATYGNDISDNLDLQAVASVFGDSRSLEDFERRLNDPSLRLSNLDLNNDGYVDYLRVVEIAEGYSRIIVIQSVIGRELYQDVATIELERHRSRGTVSVQIVGNPFIYGVNYIYEPYYYRTPVFFDYFWSPSYRPYYSPWYWGYYPTYYTYWAPVSVFHYSRNVYNCINRDNQYIYTDNRRITSADRIYSNISRSDYARANASRSFSSRNENASNRYVLENNRGIYRSENGVINRGESSFDRSINNSSRNSFDSSSSRTSRDIYTTPSTSINTSSRSINTNTFSRNIESGSSRSFNTGSSNRGSYSSPSTSGSSRSFSTSNTGGNSSRSIERSSSSSSRSSR